MMRKIYYIGGQTMDNRTIWAQQRKKLIQTLAELGYPAELGEVIARHIGSPRGIERMTAYLECVRPDRVELIADEMLAIRSDIDRWREQKESQRANAAYNVILNSGLDDGEG